ncbi:MAG: tRNA pseudouridine(38-40) synthase TruA [Deferrisomatales bacterium]
MRNIRLILEYDGTAYAGWQVQANAPTVQAAVEGALATLLKGPVRVTGSGRTDAGVHALAQPANFRTGARVPLHGFFHGLNALLPDDIAVRRVAEMPEEFDSRRSARGKTYQYFLHLGPSPSAFGRRTSWWLPRPLDLEAMREAAGHLVGTHDFSAFRSAGCDAPHAVRAVHDVWLTSRGEYAEFGIRGTAFLRHMVRIVVGTLVEVGRGKRPPSSVPELLTAGDRTLAGPTAPPQGLFLAEVRYAIEPLEEYP